MRFKALAATFTVGLVLALSACGGSSDDDASGGQPSATTTAASDAMSSRTGTFEGLNGKKVMGTVSVDGDQVVLSGFSSDEGPDLHVWLTNGTAESDVTAGTEVDAVKFDQASQTFTLSGVDAAKFDTVVIHCDKAKAVFGAAPLA
ncbi:DM13 domain-containing protein [Cellulomonas sp. HZM]|uniref:DM13 domain-containing protein n=1 Tax=Cellulomonas sp. HZM TaxID=1454010 RepID=UPI000493770A|nr:DM13 domain-containing protein [Cellulomonas sp. HZM]